MSTPTANRRVHMDPAMPDKTITTPSKSSARRALGELTPNTRVSPQKPAIATDKTQSPRKLSPLKLSRSEWLAKNENAYNIAKLPDQMTGSKRSIDEVDSANAREDATGASAKRVDGRAAAHGRVQAPMANMQASAQLASQVIDLARGNLYPTDDDTLEPTPRGTQETTGTRASFSSLIDYNPHGSSQHTSSSPPTRPTKPSTTVRADSVGVVHHDIGHDRSVARAEMLRLRLRVALYKVKTDQTFVPLSCLEIPKEYRRKPAEDDALAQTVDVSVAPLITVTAEGEGLSLSDARSSDGSAPKLLPAPVLLPTAYSTRFISEPQTAMPSSPPHSANTADGATHSSSTPRARSGGGLQGFVTPVASRQAAGQLSSPPYSVDHGRHRAHNDSDSLPSSAVKDRAADALLKLTRSV